MIKTGSIEKNAAASGPGKPEALDGKKQAKLRKATQEFESVFVGYMLKTMRGTVPKSDLSGESFGGDVLDGMFDVEMAQHLSRNGGLGLAKMLYRQLTGGDLLTGSTPDAGGIDLNDIVKPLGLPPRGPATSGDTVSQRVGKFDDVIREAGDTHAVDPNVLKAVIAAESGGNPTAVSKKDARGLMQLIDSTATDMGVTDSLDPLQNVLGGAKYLKQLLDQFHGDLKLALAAYNAGPGAVIEHKGIPPFKETKNYVNKVLNYLHVFESEEKDE